MCVALKISATFVSRNQRGVRSDKRQSTNNNKTMDKAKLYAGICIMAGLIVMGTMIPVAVNKYMSYTRTVDVKGLCEREVKADKVIWPIVYKVMGDDLNNVYQQVDVQNKKVLDFLKQGGITDAEISVSAPNISDKFANEYGNDRMYRYVCKNVITVCTNEVDKVIELMSKQAELIKEGIVINASENWENPTEFKFEGLNELKPSMVEEATKNARETAEKFATDSDSELGKIKKASQGSFSIENRDSNTPHIKRVRVVSSITYYLSN